MLPPTLQELVLPPDFNHPIAPNTFPQSLVSITFGQRFNQRIGANNLPSGLRYLKLNRYFDQPFEQGDLPQGLEYLEIFPLYRHQLPSPLPESLIHLVGVNQANLPLPPRVVHLAFFSVHSPTLSGLTQLTSLKLCYKVSLRNLPSNLQHLDTGPVFNEFIEPGLLPQTLQSLQVGIAFAHRLMPGSIPASVTHFTCDSLRQRPMSRELLPSVTHVTINTRPYNSPWIIENRPKYIQELSDFILSLLQVGGITVRCQCTYQPTSHYITLRMLDNHSILTTTPFQVTIITQHNLYSLIAEHIIDRWPPKAMIQRLIEQTYHRRPFNKWCNIAAIVIGAVAFRLVNTPSIWS
eukprot:gene16892-20086_t